MRKTGKFIFFWGGPFSQWHRSNFTIEGIRYNCAEQFMMAEKARTFKDDLTLAKILKETDPKQQKRHGREVRGFNESTWNAIARDLVEQGNIAKFSQDKNLKRLLLETCDLTIVEASPYDKIWGIGLAEQDPRVLNPSQWRGTNWLGEVLMRVRDKLKA